MNIIIVILLIVLFVFFLKKKKKKKKDIEYIAEPLIKDISALSIDTKSYTTPNELVILLKIKERV